MSNSMKLFDNCSALFGAFYLHFQYSEKKFVFIETDRLCKVVKLSMQCCGQILKDSFETYINVSTM